MKACQKGTLDSDLDSKCQCIQVNTIQKADLNGNFICQMRALSTSHLHSLLSRS